MSLMMSKDYKGYQDPALSILRKEQSVTFREFTKVGVIVCTIQLFIGTIYLVLTEFIFNNFGGGLL